MKKCRMRGLYVPELAHDMLKAHEEKRRKESLRGNTTDIPESTATVDEENTNDEKEQELTAEDEATPDPASRLGNKTTWISRPQKNIKPPEKYHDFLTK